MIDTEELTHILYVIENHLGIYSGSEIDGYTFGSYKIPPKYRGGLSYLELYYFILSHSLEILNYGLNYEDFNITTDDLIYVIDKSNELMFYYDIGE